MSQQVALGLNVPDQLPVGVFPELSEGYEELTDAEIKDLANNPEVFNDPSWLSNQNPRNSCCGHAFTHAAERAYFRKYGEQIQLQPHFLYAHINGGSDNGALLVDGARALMKYGVPTIQDAPDANRIYMSQYPNAQALYPKCIKGLELFECRTEKSAMNAMARRFPLVVAVHVDDNYVNKPNLPPVNNGPGNHAICLDDYAWDGTKYVFRNPGSWGNNIGLGGYWNLSYAHLRTPNQYHVFYAIPSVTKAPGEGEPPEARD